MRISSVDYRLKRRAAIREYRRGAVSRYEVCDAHPEIGRIARNIGEATRRDCPICGQEKLRRVNFVYGRDLAENNGRAYPLRQIFNGFKDRYPDFTCYIVEVCVNCQWHHLLKSIRVTN